MRSVGVDIHLRLENAWPMRLAMKCAECGSPFEPKRPWGRFCQPAHQRRFHELMKHRGQVIMPLLIAAAETRGRYKDARNPDLARYSREMADALISRWLVEDRAAGRSCAIVSAAKMDSGWRAADALG